MKKSKQAHLLIMRLSAMGDVAMVVPVLKAFREQNPDVRITVFTRPFFQPFFRELDGISFLTPDFNGRHKGIVGIIRLWRDISACGISHVADLHNVIRTKILRNLLIFSGQKVAVIDKGREEKRELTRKYDKISRQLKTTIERYTDTIRDLGFQFPDAVPPIKEPLPIPEAITDIVGTKEGTWIGFAPFAQHKGKIYPASHSDRLIGLLTAKYDKVFIFGGGEYEKEFAEAMERRHEGAVSVIGKIKLGAELDLISNLDLIVSMDSSAMHMASLVATPVVSVWGATHPYAGFYGFGQDPDNAVQLDMQCRPCSIYGNKPCMYGDYRCMEKLEPELIAEKVDSALENICKG